MFGQARATDLVPCVGSLADTDCGGVSDCCALPRVTLDGGMLGGRRKGSMGGSSLCRHGRRQRYGWERQQRPCLVRLGRRGGLLIWARGGPGKPFLVTTDQLAPSAPVRLSSFANALDATKSLINACINTLDAPRSLLVPSLILPAQGTLLWPLFPRFVAHSIAPQRFL